MKISPNEIVGNSSGHPPACQTPRLTASASARRPVLQWFNSLHELQLPITGRGGSSAVHPTPWEPARRMSGLTPPPPNAATPPPRPPRRSATRFSFAVGLDHLAIRR